MSTRRTLAYVTPQDSTNGGKRRPRTMCGYGPGYLSWLGEAKHRSISWIMRVRRIPLHDPIVAVAWGLARRGKGATATAVLRDFGYSRRYRVSRKTLVAI